ncbi:MAG: polysaccharide pyruvyl transferase family protein [Atopobiaceae bacterium]|jgi:hypothetical protein
MPDVGIITYHAPYNFGSALQALATQKVVSSLGYDLEIIDYRLKPQLEYYGSLYRKNLGIKNYLQDLLMKPIVQQRLKRQDNYENFFRTHYKLSRFCREPEQVQDIWNDYSIIISGSDQIWNKHSNELNNCDWEYMGPYLLKGFTGRKISYASSIGAMSQDEIKRISPLINEFDFVSMREKQSANLVSRISGRDDIKVVSDPTLLLTANEWREALDLTQEEKDECKGKRSYVVYYTLRRTKSLAKSLHALKAIADKLDADVRLITPFAYVPVRDKRLHYCVQYGPIEFFKAIDGAKAVITDSYHGTLFSMNLHKDLYCLCPSDGAEFRKTEILRRMGAAPRILQNVDEILSTTYEPIDFAFSDCYLKDLRKQSIAYLKGALDACSA